MRMKDKNAETALHLLKQSGLPLIEAARLVLDLVEAGSVGGASGNLFQRCRRVVQLGGAAVQQEEHSVPFVDAVRYTLQVKQHRSARTLSDIAYYMRRLVRCAPWLEGRVLRALTPAECRQALQSAFPTPSQQRKARAILSGVFTVGRRQGWCGENPVQVVEAPHVQEQEIAPLPLPEVRELLHTAQSPAHRRALPAVALMLYAGVRPQELTRLNWHDVDLEEQELCIAPRHSKTGGARRIPLSRPLVQLLARSAGVGRICPPNWRNRWQRLRQEAGFARWVPDVLRHTFASYYIKQHRDMTALQLCMGHRDQRLLMTRYINLQGITRRDAASFWSMKL